MLLSSVLLRGRIAAVWNSLNGYINTHLIMAVTVQRFGTQEGIELTELMENAYKAQREGRTVAL